MFAKINLKIDAFMCKIGKRHPILFYLIIFIVAPLFVMLAVFICTYVIMLPISWLMGWI